MVNLKVKVCETLQEFTLTSGSCVLALTPSHTVINVRDQ